MYSMLHALRYPIINVQGNRKGPVKRWDFENEEDYGNYQSSREALPKYAITVATMCKC